MCVTPNAIQNTSPEAHRPAAEFACVPWLIGFEHVMRARVRDTQLTRRRGKCWKTCVSSNNSSRSLELKLELSRANPNATLSRAGGLSLNNCDSHEFDA
jgi:hypothetical protein